MQTLGLINVDNISLSTTGFRIRIPGKTKTSGLNRKQPILVIQFYHKDTSICAASALQNYLERTKEIRKDVRNLFISFRKPHGVVSTQTISRWIKTMLEKCGIDTSIFSAYSTRHASTSTAKNKGISIVQIKKTAGWTEKSKTFAQFYDLPIECDPDQYANTILAQGR